MAVPTVTCNSSQCQGVKPVMQQRHFISHPDQTGHARSTSARNQNYYKRAIVNDRKRKSSRIHVLCDDVVLQSALGLHSLFCRMQSEQCTRVKTSSKVTSKRRPERKKPTKGAKMTQLGFVSNGRGGQFAVFTKNVDFSRLQTKLGCALSFLENAIMKGFIKTAAVIAQNHPYFTLIPIIPKGSLQK